MQDIAFLNSDLSRSKARWWLLVGVAALSVAGLFSLILVVARTPALAQIPLFSRLFHEALVVHVNLSVLVWFISIAALFWSLLAASAGRPPLFYVPYIERFALISFGGGAALMALSPLDRSGGALMSNYIPVIANIPFFLSLALLLCGMGFMLVKLVVAWPKPAVNSGLSHALCFGIAGSAFIGLVALVAFIWSYHVMPTGLEQTQYYDMLFWAGGHVLQFMHVQVQMLCFLLLAGALVSQLTLSPKVLIGLFAIGPLTAFISLYPLAAYDITSMEFRDFYTRVMIIANGIAPLVLAVMLVWRWKLFSKAKENRALKSSLLASMVLFFYGGALGALIQGQNVVIPAHYHGSIVSVTLALMGVAYMLLPRFGWRDVASWRLAYWQPAIYAFGQLLHISGLAWSGGYGVLRKTPGALEGGVSSAKVAMGLMGLGGLLAIIGGLMFVVVVIRSIFTHDKITKL